MILDFKKGLEEALESMEEPMIDEFKEEERQKIEKKLQSQYSMKEDKLEAHLRDWRRPTNKTLTRSDITWSYTKIIMDIFDRWYGMTDTDILDKLQEAANIVQGEAFQRLVQNENLGSGISKAQKQAVAEELSQLYLQRTPFADLEEAIQNLSSRQVRVPKLMLCFTRASKELSASSANAIRSLIRSLKSEIVLEITDRNLETYTDEEDKYTPRPGDPGYIMWISDLKTSELKIALMKEKLANDTARIESENCKDDDDDDMTSNVGETKKHSWNSALSPPRRTQWPQQSAAERHSTRIAAMQHRKNVKLARQASPPGWIFRKDCLILLSRSSGE